MTERAEVIHTHPGHWEWSWAPLLVVLGVFFAVPITFAGWFQYENPLIASVAGGIGAVLLLSGVAKWVSEGLSQHGEQYGYATFALPVFIVSEVFIFLGLFTSYWMIRLKALDAEWPPAGTPHMEYLVPIIMTIILVSSSFTIHIGEEKLEEKDEAGFRTWLMATIALGIIFLGFTVYEYNHLLHQGFGPSTNSYSTAFYSITGFHASHVFVGICIFAAVAIPAFSGKTNKTFVTCASVYWHFVDIVWFFVVSQVYFW